MKILICGLPCFEKTTVAMSLVRHSFRFYSYKELYYLNATDWIKETFRKQKENETDTVYHEFILNRIKINPNFILDNIKQSTGAHDSNNWVIDGLFSPKDFSELFNPNYDVVVFFNKNVITPHKEYESIGISVIRNYCFWLASANLLSKERWIEINYKDSQEDFEVVKNMENTILSANNTDKIIDILLELINLL